MSFAPVDLFDSVVAADAGRLLNGFHTLRIQNGSARVRISAHALTRGSVQGALHMEPVALEAPTTRVALHRLPGWKVGGQITPWAAGAQDGDESIDDVRQQVRSWPATAWRGGKMRGKMRLQAHPLSVGETAQRARTHAQQSTVLYHLSACQNTLSETGRLTADPLQPTRRHRGSPSGSPAMEPERVIAAMRRNVANISA